MHLRYGFKQCLIFKPYIVGHYFTFISVTAQTKSNTEEERGSFGLQLQATVHHYEGSQDQKLKHRGPITNPF